jgi:Zn-dependent alcohol dehydrogenase
MSNSVDYTLEVIGQPTSIRQAYDSLCKRGMVVVVGVAPNTMEVSVPIMTLVFEERTLTGAIYGFSLPQVDVLMLINLYKAGS